MFDSFHVEQGEISIELQTKRFGCTLQGWSIGECVDPAPHGIITFYDTIWLDENKEQKWNDGKINTTVFITIANGIFVEGLIKETFVSEKGIKDIIIKQNEKWSDTNLFMNFAVQKIGEQQNKIRGMEILIQDVSEKIRVWMNPELKDRDPIFPSCKVIPDEIKNNHQLLRHLEDTINKKVEINYEFLVEKELDKYKL